MAIETTVFNVVIHVIYIDNFCKQNIPIIKANVIILITSTLTSIVESDNPDIFFVFYSNLRASGMEPDA